jgi:phosphomannomutase
MTEKFDGLMEGVSGVRGIVGGGLTPEIACRYASAYGTMIGGGEIVVGQDGRPSGPMLFDAVCAGLRAVGCNVLDIGIALTPTIQIIIQKRHSQGGISITASHNPQMWNALKFFSTSTLFLDEIEGARLKRIIIDGDFAFVGWDQLGSRLKYNQAIEDHIKTVLDIPYLDLASIRRQGFKVAVDCINAGGSRMIPELLGELGCTTFKLNCEATGIFPHEAEPLPQNLGDLCKLVIESGADLGVAVDPDGDRLALVDEKGKPVGEELSLVIATDFILNRKPGPVVANVSTTRALDDLALKYGVQLHRTKVGEVHVAKKMAQVKAVIGGEGNGGVILPEAHLGRDAPVGIALILQYLSERDLSLSRAVSNLPSYHIVKEKLQIAGCNKEQLYEFLSRKITDVQIDTTDGMKFNYPQSWAQVRASNTEPIIRLYAEAETEDQALKLCAMMEEKIFEFNAGNI